MEGMIPTYSALETAQPKWSIRKQYENHFVGGPLEREEERNAENHSDPLDREEFSG